MEPFAELACATHPEPEKMLTWLVDMKRDTYSKLIATSIAMRQSTTQPYGNRISTAQCSVRMLAPRQISQQHENLAMFWRRPQPNNNREVGSYLDPVAARDFLGTIFDHVKGMELSPLCYIDKSHFQ